MNIAPTARGPLFTIFLPQRAHTRLSKPPYVSAIGCFRELLRGHVRHEGDGHRSPHARAVPHSDQLPSPSPIRPT